ncbi:MAG: metallophosphoesterase family protein [Chloroflexi bacterium]|nr:metallophosphoesterase family protein [Chloroflexota bacterium]
MAVEIGVLSDTHWPTRVSAIQWEAIEAAFAGVSLILHAGDIETPDVLERLTQIAPVEAVLATTTSSGCRCAAS